LDYDHDKEQPDIKDMIQDEDYELYDWNREPTKAEIAACKPHIDEIVEAEKPKGIIYLGKVAESYKTKLPKISLLHPAAIARLEYKLLPTLRQARKITNFVDKLTRGTQ
jgi:uracil-DNA glycosylase family 4